MTHLDRGVVKRESLPVMVNSYNDACKEVDQAFELFESAKTRLESAFGAGASFDCVYQMRYCSNSEEIKKDIKKRAWEAFLNRLEVKKFMSIKDLSTLEKSFEDVNKIPEITIETLIEIQTGMMNTAPDYAKRMAIEAFNILMPGNSEFNHHKTNDKNARRKLGKKIILTWCLESEYYGDSFHLNFYADQKIMCVDKVFYALDGKGVPPGYNTPLVDAINRTSLSVGCGETDYFKFKCYLNNNLHLEFKRMDLVEKINRVAGNSTTLTD